MLTALLFLVLGAAGVTAFILIPGWLGIALGIIGGALLWSGTLALLKRLGWF